MLSVLIPTYNYLALPLVKEIKAQLDELRIGYEILVYDDASKGDLEKTNSTIDKLKYCSYTTIENNIGRSAIRGLLAKNAKFENLLFLDADVLPKNKTFIKNYITHITFGYEIVLGGFAYRKKDKKKDSLLRWKYGKNREEVDAYFRNKNPFKVIISANMLIKKETFLSINTEMTTNIYGLDNYFGSLLKQQNIQVLHINNEVFHLGIDDSKTYLKKKELAAETLLKLYKDGRIKTHSNDLLSCFILLKKYKLNYFFYYLYLVSKKLLKINLLGNNPSINLLQLYRLYYMCHIDLKVLK